MKWFTSLISDAIAPSAPDASVVKPAPAAPAPPTTRAIALNGKHVDYLLVRKRGRRGVGLRIDGKGMSVMAPLGASITTIEDMITKHESWVVNKLEEWAPRRVIAQSFADDAQLYFLGNTLSLRYIAAPVKPRVELDGEQLLVYLKAETIAAPDCEAQVSKLVLAWMRKQALPHFAQRAFFFARQHNYVPPRVMLSSALGRWGSCNSKREVRFSWRLIKARPALVDYVVCHELAHLRHMNHSNEFWAEVELMCPDYRTLKIELDKSDHLFRAY
jgi:predicted metal-dependent hydrolase